jgi:hypothetical protein
VLAVPGATQARIANQLGPQPLPSPTPSSPAVTAPTDPNTLHGQPGPLHTQVQQNIATTLQQINEVSTQYNQRAQGKAAIQHGMDDVRQLFNEGYKDDQFKNIGKTQEAMQELQRLHASGRISDDQTAQRLGQITDRFKTEFERVSAAQQDNAEWGLMVKNVGRGLTVVVAGVGGTVAGTPALGGVAAVGAGMGFDLLDAALFTSDPNSGFTPKLQVNSLGSVAGLALRGEEVRTTDVLQGGLGTAGDFFTGRFAGQSMNNINSLRTNPGSLRFTGNAVTNGFNLMRVNFATTLQQTTVNTVLQAGKIEANADLNAQQKSEAHEQNARSIPGQLVSANAGNFLGGTINFRDSRVLDVFAQGTGDTAINLAQASWDKGFNGDGFALNSREMVQSIAQGYMGQFLPSPDNTLQRPVGTADTPAANPLHAGDPYSTMAAYGVTPTLSLEQVAAAQRVGLVAMYSNPPGGVSSSGTPSVPPQQSATPPRLASDFTVASGQSFNTFGQNINPLLRNIHRDLIEGPLHMPRFEAGGSEQQQVAQVNVALRQAGINPSGQPQAAQQIITMARALDVSAVPLAQQLAGRTAQTRTAMQEVNSRNSHNVDGQHNVWSLAQGTDYLTHVLAQGTFVTARTMPVEVEPGQIYDVQLGQRLAQTSVLTDLDGVLAYASKGLDVRVDQANNTANHVFVPLGDQPLPLGPLQPRVQPGADGSHTLQVRDPEQQQTLELPITPAQKALLERGAIGDARYVEGASAGVFPPESMAFLHNVSLQNIRTGGELTGGLLLPRVNPISMRTMGVTPFNETGTLVTEFARSLSPGQVTFQMSPQRGGPIQVTRPQGVPTLQGLDIYSGGTAVTRGGTTQFFALNPRQQQAMQTVAAALPDIVNNLSNEYRLSPPSRQAFADGVWPHPDSPAIVIPDIVRTELNQRTQDSHPDKLLPNLQADIDRQLGGLINSLGMRGFVNLHHTPTGRTSTSDDAVIFARTPEQEAGARALAQARGEAYKPEAITTDWNLAPHSQKGMAVLDSVVNRLQDQYGIDLKAQLAAQGHPYSSIARQSLPQFLQFLHDTVRPMITAPDGNNVDLGRVIVPVDTYRESGNQLSGTDASMIQAAAALYGRENTHVVHVSSAGRQPSERQFFTFDLRNTGDVRVDTPSVDPLGPNADLAPTMYVRSQDELGQMMRDAYNNQLPLSQAEIAAVRNRSWPATWSEYMSRTVFTGAEQNLLSGADKVYVHAFSSQGGGHTQRSMDPILAAIDTGVITDKDVVLLALPPHWESDKGNEADRLQKYEADLKKRGINFVTVQQDRAVLGFYKPDGPSDNWRILQNFASMDAREPWQTRVPEYGSFDPKGGSKQPVRYAVAFDAAAIMQQAVAAAGSKDKFVVFTDMDPYIARGALYQGIPRQQIIDLSNHILLVDRTTDNHLNNAFLNWANVPHAGSTSAIELNDGINKLPGVNETIARLNMEADTSQVAARQQVIDWFMGDGNKWDLASDDKITTAGSILVHPRATPQSIDRVVVLYINDYTDPLGQHIRNRLNAGDENYAKTLFIVAGRSAFKSGGNALHAALLANADAVFSAGWGTTTEMHQLLTNGYQGRLIIAPVENQNEQLTNVPLLRSALPSDLRNRVESASNAGDLKAKLDDLVSYQATTTSGLNGDMGSLFNTLSGERRVTDQTVNLLSGGNLPRDDAGGPTPLEQRLTQARIGIGQMTTDETRLRTMNTAQWRDYDNLASRRIVNAIVPALDAALKGDTHFTVKMDRSYSAQPMTLRQLADALNIDVTTANAARLLHANVEGRGARALLTEVSNRLDELANADPAQRRQLAEEFIHDFANHRFFLGY